VSTPLTALMEDERSQFVLQSFPNLDLLAVYDTKTSLQDSGATYRDTRGTMPLNATTLARVASTITIFIILRDWSSKRSDDYQCVHGASRLRELHIPCAIVSENRFRVL
jgi:hypothetical protein